jgi:hypothetical protein
MKKLNVHEAKTHLSQRKEKRPIGLAKGEFEVPPAFFDPFPDDILAGFEGEEA